MMDATKQLERMRSKDYHCMSDLTFGLNVINVGER